VVTGFMAYISDDKSIGNYKSLFYLCYSLCCRKPAVRAACDWHSRSYHSK